MAGLLLVVITLAVYWPARQNDFLSYDDAPYFTENPHVLGGLTGSGFAWAFTSTAEANWHPLTWLSLMLDAEIFGPQPAGPHLVNLLLHAANAVLLFLLLSRLTRTLWRSALVAALFALHPLHVESVAWVAERKDLLCAFFLFWAMLAYAAYAAAVAEETPGTPSAARRRSRYYWGALLGFALALMSKPMAVTLPFLLLLLDWWPLNRITDLKRWRDWKPLLVEKIPFFGLSVAASLITWLAQQRGGAVATLAAFPFLARLENAFVAYALYLAKTFWPAPLALPYPHPGHWPVAVVAVSAGLFIGLSVWAVWTARRWPFVFTGWFWFAGMLVPVIGLVQVGDQAMADRYSYLPLIGLFIALVWGEERLAAHRAWPRRQLGLAAAMLLLVCAGRTRGQLSYWRNDGTLFAHALAVTRDNYTANVKLAGWLTRRGQFQEAAGLYERAVAIRPGDPTAWYNYGNSRLASGDVAAAIQCYQKALPKGSDWPAIRHNYGVALAAQGQVAAAITNFEYALKLKPDFASAHNSLGTARFKQGQMEAAAREFSEAIRLAPDNPTFRANLGDVWNRLGRTNEAVQCYQQALRLNPEDERTAGKLKRLQVP